MGHYLAAGSGGYQAFTLRGVDWAWLVFAVACAVVAIATGFLMRRQVLASDPGTPKMLEIAKAIQEGAAAYLKRQFMTIGVVIVPLAVLVFLTATKVVNPATGHTVLGFGLSGLYRMLAFLVGAALSGLAGLIGMTTAVRANVRTAAAAAQVLLAKGVAGGDPRRWDHRCVRRRLRPARDHGHRDARPAHRDSDPDRFRLRVFALVAVHACGRRCLHQGCRRRRRPRRQGRGGNTRRRPP